MRSGDLGDEEAAEKVHVAADRIQQVPRLSPDPGHLRYMQSETDKKVCDLRISACTRADVRTRPTPSKNRARMCTGSSDAHNTMSPLLDPAGNEDPVRKQTGVLRQYIAERVQNPIANQEGARQIHSSKPHRSAAILRLPPHLLAQDPIDSAPPSPGSFQGSPRQLNMSLLSVHSIE